MYYYRSLIKLLQRMYRCEDFASLCNLHLTRENPGCFDDIQDGSMWRVDNGDFFSHPNHLGLSLHFDDMNPRGKESRVRHSTGILTITVANIPSHIRNRERYLLHVGFVPGPKQPKRDINSLIQPLVAELKLLESAGIMCGNTIVKARLALVACDLLALWRLTQHLGHSSRCGCPWCVLVAKMCCRKRLKSGEYKYVGSTVKIGKGYSNTTLWATDLDEFGECMSCSVSCRLRAFLTCGLSCSHQWSIQCTAHSNTCSSCTVTACGIVMSHILKKKMQYCVKRCVVCMGTL